MGDTDRRFPEAARLQIEALISGLRDVLSDDLVGVYLHGSLAMGCFSPALSDLDVLAVVERAMTVEAKRTAAELLLRLSGSPHPIEISVLRRRDLEPWEHPTPFDFHYSEMWRERHAAELAGGGWRSWNEPERQHRDPDLAAHVTIARQRGIRLCGAPIDQVFPTVPREDYVASILGDVADARATIGRNPVYGVLNLCRVYWYLSEGRIASKAEAGAWGVFSLPDGPRDVAARALAIYHGQSEDQGFEVEALERFARQVGDAIEALAAGSAPEALSRGQEVTS